MELEPDYIFLVKSVWRLINNKLREIPAKFCAESIIRSTNNGQVKGIKRTTIYDQTYYSFEGIPFAKPPIGELRFKEPEPVESWEGIRNCSYARAVPIQKNLLFNFVEGSEDCLYLNIYVKELNTEKPLPVIVYIHGGGYQVGQASRDLSSPDYFMEKELVIVTITYRMAAFGFLSLKDPKYNIPGNAGIKDQIMALEWIKANIRNFNGDPNNITVLGQSAGALSAHLIMCCERAKGLFHKAILMSTTALCTWSIFPQHNWAYRLAYKIGYIGPNEDGHVYDFLSKVDARKIAMVHSYLFNERERRERYNAPIGPIIEPYETKNAVITKPVLEALKNAWGNEIPVIIGATSFEGLLMYANTLQFPYLINELDNCEAMVPREIQSMCTTKELREFGQSIKQFYFNNEKPTFEKDLMSYLQLLGDYILLSGIHRGLISRLKYAPSRPTYYYRFDYDSKHFNIFRLFYVPGKFRGAIHTSDLQYLFFNMLSWKLDIKSLEYLLIKRMVGMFSSFAYNSDPNCVEIEPVKWEPANKFDINQIKLLRISENVEMVDVPEKERLDLWDNIYKKIEWC